MAERSSTVGPLRSWLVALALVGCVALEVAVASSTGQAAPRATALLGLAAVAVALSLQQALNGVGASRGLRTAVVVPIALSIALTVVLMLDAHGRGAGLAP